MIVGFESLDLQVVLGLSVAVKAQVVGQLHVTFHLLQKSLVQLGPLSGHARLDFLPTAHDASLHQVKLHLLTPPVHVCSHLPVPHSTPSGPLLSTLVLTDGSIFLMMLPAAVFAVGMAACQSCMGEQWPDSLQPKSQLWATSCCAPPTAILSATH
jgi:hypothetical protein